MNIIAKLLRKKATLLIIPLSIYLLFGLHHIAKFETADEHLWIYDPIEGRIHNYWKAIRERDYAKTRINDKPGVSLAYISGIGAIFENNARERVLERKRTYAILNPQKSEQINFKYRLPIFIFNGVFSFVFYWLIKKITGHEWLALIISSLILLNPVLLGISQIVNPDSLLWVFSFACFLSFIAFLKFRELKFGLLTSLFFGFALLSKYTAIILIPAFLGFSIFYIYDNYKEWDSKRAFGKNNLKIFFGYILIFIIGFMIFSILMPAVFYNWKLLYAGTIGFNKSNADWVLIPFFSMLALFFIDAVALRGKILGNIVKWTAGFKNIFVKSLFLFLSGSFLLAILNWSLGNNFLGVVEIPFDAGRDGSLASLNLFQKILTEIKIPAFSLPPFLLIIIVSILVAATIRRVAFGQLILFSSFFIFLFYGAVISQGLMANIRYTVIIYPFLITLASIGIIHFTRWEIRSDFFKMTTCIVIIAISTFSLWSIKPFYFNYTNSLLPKNKIITGAWGYGGYEAAHYLNALPDAENLKIFADYNGTCSFFKGICVNDNIRQYKPLGSDPYYYVITRRGSIRNSQSWPAVQEQHPNMEMIWEMIIDGRPENFIRIFKDENYSIDK